MWKLLRIGRSSESSIAWYSESPELLNSRLNPLVVGADPRRVWCLPRFSMRLIRDTHLGAHSFSHETFQCVVYGSRRSEKTWIFVGAATGARFPLISTDVVKRRCMRAISTF